MSHCLFLGRVVERKSGHRYKRPSPGLALCLSAVRQTEVLSAFGPLTAAVSSISHVI